MELSSESLDKEFSTLKRYYGEKDPVTLIKNLDEEVKIKELEYLKSFKPCSYPNEDFALLQQYHSMDTKLYEKLLLKEYYNPSLMSLTSCLISSLSKNVGEISYQNRLREVLLDLRRIGDESVYGHAILSSFIGINDMLVLKVPKGKGDELLHEAFVGIFGTNRIRTLIPNFAYIYGYFDCSSPVLNDKKVVSFCNSDKLQKTYIVYENIKDSVTFADYFTNNDNFEDFRKLYLQVLLVLLLAYEEIGFSHNDLHGKNVLIRNTPEDVILEFRFKGVPIYLKTRKIVTFIDFGLSSVSFEGKVYGYNKPYLYKAGIFGSDSFPLGDTYKLLMNIISKKLKDKEMKSFHDISKILSFFTNDSPSKFIVAQTKNYFNLPRFKDLMGAKKLEDLITMMINMNSFNNSGFILRDLFDKSLLFRCEGGCSSEVDLFSALGMSKDPEVSTLVDYYDYLNSGGQSTISDEDLEFLLSGNTSKINKEVKEFYEEAKEFSLLINSLSEVSFKSLEQELSKYQKLHLVLESCVLLRDSLFFKFAALRFILINFYSNRGESELEKIEDYSITLGETLNSLIGMYQEKVIKVNEALLEIKTSSPEKYQREFSDKKGRLHWYLEESFKGEFLNINVGMQTKEELGEYILFE